MKKLIIIALLLMAGTTYAQVNYQLSSAVDFVRTYKIASGEYYSELTEKDIQGSPFLNQEFVNGSVYTTTKFQYADIPLRYNIYNDNIEFKTPENKILAIAQPETIDKITFGDYTMEYLSYMNVKKYEMDTCCLSPKAKQVCMPSRKLFIQKLRKPVLTKNRNLQSLNVKAIYFTFVSEPLLLNESITRKF